MSLPQIVDDLVRTRTSPCPGCGISYVRNSTVLFPGSTAPCMVPMGFSVDRREQDVNSRFASIGSEIAKLERVMKLHADPFGLLSVSVPVFSGRQAGETPEHLEEALCRPESGLHRD